MINLDLERRIIVSMYGKQATYFDNKKTPLKKINLNPILPLTELNQNNLQGLPLNQAMATHPATAFAGQ